MWSASASRWRSWVMRRCDGLEAVCVLVLRNSQRLFDPSPPFAVPAAPCRGVRVTPPRPSQPSPRLAARASTPTPWPRLYSCRVRLGRCRREAWPPSREARPIRVLSCQCPQPPSRPPPALNAGLQPRGAYGRVRSRAWTPRGTRDSARTGAPIAICAYREFGSIG